jgi:excisionase family DNA binding protein
MLGISERLLWTWTHAGTIPHVRIGSRVLYPVEQLRQWLSQQATVPRPAADQ